MSGWHDPKLASEWDAVAEQSPAREHQLDLLVAALADEEPGVVLEIGVGSGRVAERVLECLPRVRLVGCDVSEAMLELARGRLRRFGDRVELVAGDLRRPETIGLPPAAFDAGYSVQALHHLDDPAKARVFAWLGVRLEMGALFLLRDKVTVPERLHGAYAVVWRAQGDDLPSEPAAYARSLAVKQDVPATLQAHLEWLSAAGFEAGVPHAEGHYALIAARRIAARSS
jgi:SAM-dependent methyltransferase